MPEDNNDRGETDRGKEMRDRQNALGPQPVNPEQFSEAGTYMEPNAAQIPWPNVPYDPADSRPNPNSEIEGQAEELTGKKPTMDRFGNPIEEVPAPRGEPQDVAGGIAYNPPTAEELAENRAGNLNQSRQSLEQRGRRQTQNQGQGQGEHPHGGPPGQTGEHPQGGPPGQQPRPNQDLPEQEQQRQDEERRRQDQERQQAEQKRQEEERNRDPRQRR